MASRRMIASDTFEDEFIGELSYFERLLWIGLITTVADDQGRLMDNPALIRSKVFLFDNVLDSEVETALNKINVAGKIARYVVGNKSLIQIVNWWKYQTPSWASPSKYKPPEGWNDRVKYHGTGNKIVVQNWDKDGGYVADYVAPKVDDCPTPLDSPINKRREEEIREGNVAATVYQEYYEGVTDMKRNVTQIQSRTETETETEANSGGAGDSLQFTNMRNLLTTIVGLTATPKDIEGIEELVELGVTEEDIRDALGWRKDNGKKPVRTLSQLFEGCKTSRNIRVQNDNSNTSKKSVAPPVAWRVA